MRRETQAAWLGLGAAGLVAAIGIGVTQTVVAAKTESVCNTPTTLFCDSLVKPPPEWKGKLFKLSQDYPSTLPKEALPWSGIDPAWEPDKYAFAVLDYFYEGSIRKEAEQSFQTDLNTVRKWYHAPWLDAGANGREPLQGLTRERSSRKGELGPEQKQLWNNWAVGFYNAPGGIALGKIWADHGKPNVSASAMPEGTVAAKLLFTTANETEVPFLKGSPVWRAYVYEDVHLDRHSIDDKRAILPLRLLQIDFAVKDLKHSPTTGWVFGTFVYGGGKVGSQSGWRNVAPVGLMWGNDPNYSGSGELREMRINPYVTLVHYGYQRRLNGPVDNPKSSCMSCHGTAELPQSALLPADGATPEEVARFFVNVPSGKPFTPGAASADYSLQVSMGIMAFNEAQVAKQQPAAKRTQFLKHLEERDEIPARDGGNFQ